jgi:hypothetical protein
MSNLNEDEYAQQYEKLKFHFLDTKVNNRSDQIITLILAGLLKTEEAEQFYHFAAIYSDANKAIIHFRQVPQITEIVIKARKEMIRKYC